MASIIGVQELQHTNGTSAMTIDSSGRVTMPVVPAWRVSITSDQSFTTSGLHTVQLDQTDTENCFLNGGVTISSYKIVAPVSGIYAVNAYARINSIGSGYVQCNISVNDVDTGNSDSYTIDGTPPSNYITLQTSDLFSVTANDTFTFSVYSSADTSWSLSEVGTIFAGHLVG